MAVSLSAVIGNTEYPLDDYETFIHLNNNGFGLPELDMYAESGPLQDGATYIDYRLSPRDLTLVLGLNATSSETYFERRRKLFNIFKPKRNNSLSLRLTLPDGSIRQLDTVYTNGLSADGSEKVAYYHKFAIGLRAHDPTWYNPVQNSVPFGVISSSGFTVPMSVNLNVGASTIGQTVSIEYDGTWDTYPIVTVVGPVTNLVITNATTGDKLDFTGYTLDANRTYTIDCRYARKTVIDDLGNNHIAKLATDSDLSTFRLVAAEDNSDTHINDIVVTGTSATTATRIYLQYFSRYIGI